MRNWTFDYKRGALVTTKACGGQYYDLGGDNSPSFCPLSVLETDSDVIWAEDWIATCYQIQHGGLVRLALSAE